MIYEATGLLWSMGNRTPADMNLHGLFCPGSWLAFSYATDTTSTRYGTALALSLSSWIPPPVATTMVRDQTNTRSRYFSHLLQTGKSWAVDAWRPPDNTLLTKLHTAKLTAPLSLFLQDPLRQSGIRGQKNADHCHIQKLRVVARSFPMPRRQRTTNKCRQRLPRQGCFRYPRLENSSGSCSTEQRNLSFGRALARVRALTLGFCEQTLHALDMGVVDGISKVVLGCC